MLATSKFYRDIYMTLLDYRKSTSHRDTVSRWEVELSDDLKDQLDPQKTRLEVAAPYVTKEQLLKSYLNWSFGNAYNFDLSDKIETIL